MICCIGLPLGVVATIFGARGLAFANHHPEVKGRAHAIIGLVLGPIEILVNTFLLIASVAGMIGGR